ncbi:MAG: ABC transporter ATP-binding protein [Planctomycetes bacterium]|nr:ABC transporter ATP-binding protein [Planctomycetota bacterium]MCP4839054.1 ABC transporter ATP-binding protein [Planctomycetota bacterium]
MLRCDQIEFSRGAFRLGPLSCDASAGRITAVVGPNASGKTTLLHTVAGILAPSGGRIQHHGDEERKTRSSRADELVLLPQRPAVDVPLSVQRLVELGRLRHAVRGSQERVAEALDRLGLMELRHRPVSSLSAGQAQRAHLARVWAQRNATSMLVLDEPTAPLDHRWASSVWSLLREHVSSGGGVLVAVHDLALAADAADHAWILRGGQLLASGPSELVLEPETLGEAFGASFEWATRRDGTNWLVPSSPLVRQAGFP